MIKILILFAVAALITSIGVFLSANKKKKMLVFSEMYEFNEQIILTLKFNRSSIDKIAEQFKYVDKVLSGELTFKGDCGEELKNYIANLGQTDAMSQVDYLTEKKTILKKYKDESFADYKKYSSLYVKIFFLVGVMVAILLA